VAAERGAERARRTVPDAFGDNPDCQVLASQQILRDSHAPSEQIFHRCQADNARKAHSSPRNEREATRHPVSAASATMRVIPTGGVVDEHCGDDRDGGSKNQDCQE
jgi:hypothetical protein